MPYLGNEAADRFVSQPAVDQFSGDGSTTAFTLSFPVTSDQDILVSVDGVVQDVAAYAVSSGTTLTFTAAPSSNSGNNIFVNYLARTHATVAHPATSALTATTGTFTSAFTSPGIDDNADANAITISSGELVGIGETSPTSALHVKGGAGANVAIQSTAGSHWRIGDGVGSSNGIFIIRDHTNSGNRILVNAGGEVNLPAQPCFQVKNASEQSNISINTGTTIAFGTEVIDIGANFASNTFTAPVTGSYLLGLKLNLQTVDSAADYYRLRLATANRNYDFFIDPDFGQDPALWTFHFTMVADMDASDTAQGNFYQAGGTAQTDLRAAECQFFGHLIA